MTLPPYNPDATCPKCGGGKADERWNVYVAPNGEIWLKRVLRDDQGRRVSQFVAQFNPNSAGAAETAIECARRVAGVMNGCGYAWPEAPMDKESA